MVSLKKVICGVGNVVKGTGKIVAITLVMAVGGAVYAVAGVGSVLHDMGANGTVAMEFTDKYILTPVCHLTYFISML